MKLLFDQNLSHRLVGHVRDAFPESVHVTALGLQTATDRELWDFAAEHGYIITSKDSDFRQLAFLHGPPPKALWLRVGNASTAIVVNLILDHIEAIEAFAANEAEALLVLEQASRTDSTV